MKQMMQGRVRAATAAALLAAATTVSACAGGLGAGDYSRSQAGQISRVEPGVVLTARQVQISGTKSGVGTATGAVVGGVIGSQIGGGDAERAVAGVLGAVGGGLAGAATEEAMSRQVGWAYTIRLEETGEIISIAQADERPIPENAPVWVEYGPRARVIQR